MGDDVKSADPAKIMGTTVADTREAANKIESDARKGQEETEKLRQELLQAQVAELERNKITDDVSKFVSDVERDLLFEMIVSMRHKLIAVEEARHLAKDFLALFPFQAREEVIEKMKKLSERYPEARAVYLKYAVPHMDQVERELLDRVSQHLKNGNIDEALNVAKGGS